MENFTVNECGKRNSWNRKSWARQTLCEKRYKAEARRCRRYWLLHETAVTAAGVKSFVQCCPARYGRAAMIWPTAKGAFNEYYLRSYRPTRSFHRQAGNIWVRATCIFTADFTLFLFFRSLSLFFQYLSCAEP